MKQKIISLFLLLSLSGFPILADEWLDIARDLQTHIETQVPINTDVQQQIDTHLLWAQQCHAKG